MNLSYRNFLMLFKNTLRCKRSQTETEMMNNEHTGKNIKMPGGEKKRMRGREREEEKQRVRQNSSGGSTCAHGSKAVKPSPYTGKARRFQVTDTSANMDLANLQCQ